jgi:hypothetical protein
MKGTVDVGVGAVLDGIVPPGEMPEGLDWSDINTNNFINSIKQNNPLTVRNLGREAISEGLIGAGKDQIKNYVKGDPIPVTEWKQDFTGALIDKAAPHVANAGKTAAKGVINANSALSDALLNQINNPMNLKLS